MLFLCTGNSARSQIAEALLEHRSGHAVAGPQRREPSQAAAPQRGAGDGRAWHRHLRQHAPSTSRRFARSRFDHVITLCDKVREVCPEFPGDPDRATGACADPAAEGDTDDATLPGVRADRRRARGPHRLLLIAQLVTQPKEDTPMPDDATVNVRYLVDDVAAAIDFYTQPPRLHRADTRSRRRSPTSGAATCACCSAGPQSSAGRPMPDGAQPGPGGWNRIHLIVDDLDAEIARLDAPRASPFRNEVVTGPGGAQVLVDDPSGNLVELFQPADQRERAGATCDAAGPTSTRLARRLGLVRRGR